MPSGIRSRATESDFVFNVVVTPGTFRFLGLFTRSLLAQSEVRLRLVANGCPADEVGDLRDFAGTSEGRVEVVVLSSPTMVPHGVALEEVFTLCDDGAYFCFVDSDVKARRPFMAMFLDLLTRVDAVTSCNVAWSDDTVLPPGSRDLAGRHAVGTDGFVYGGSFLAIYSRPAVERVRAQWGVTFRTYAFDQMPVAWQQRLDAMGRRFGLYDTAKVLNLLLQGEGFVLAHVDNPALVHIGGISQYLSDPSVLGRDPEAGAGAEPAAPWFALSGVGRERWDFARWTAATLRSLVDGGPVPELPADREQRSRAKEVRRELLGLVER
jgi:hypothetical protein